MKTNTCNLLNGQTFTMDSDWIIIDFRPGASTPPMQSTHAGIIPDRVDLSGTSLLRAGLFTPDEMPQNIITRAVNYKLDAIVFNEKPSPILTTNLHHTLDPDIRPGIGFYVLS